MSVSNTLNKSIRILFITPDASLYGAQKSLFRLLSNIDRHRIKPMTFFILGGPLISEIESLKIPVIIYQKPRLVPDHYGSRLGRLGQMISWIFVILQLVKLIKKNNIDIVYANTSVIIFSLIAGVLTRRKTVCHIHENKFPGFKQQILLFSIRLLSNKIIGVSEKIKDLFPSSVVQKKYVTIYNGLDFNQFCDLNSFIIEKSLNIHENISLIAQIIPHKGLEYFVDAMSIIHEDFPGIHALIIGGIPRGYEKYFDRIQEKIKIKNLDNVIIMTGFVEDIRPFLIQTKIVVLCSLREAFGLALLEAMAFERPVIGTNVGGIPDLIEDQRTGLLIPPKDSYALAIAIKKILDNPELAAKMGKRGKDRALRLFDIRKQVQIWEESLL